MWLEARRLASGDCVEFRNSFPPPTPGISLLQHQQKCSRNIPSQLLGKREKTKIYTCLGARAGATLLTNTHNTHSSTPEPPDVKNTHSRGLRPLPPTPKKRTFGEPEGPRRLSEAPAGVPSGAGGGPRDQSSDYSTELLKNLKGQPEPAGDAGN